MELTFENWDEPQDETELRLLKKSLKKRNRRLILTSTALILALLLFGWTVLLPVVESRYWDPTECTYLEDVTDLELTMCVYTELFGQGQLLMPPDIRKIGFAAYSIDSCFLEWESMNALTSLSYRSAAVEKSEWKAESNFWNQMQRGVIYSYPERTKNDFVSDQQKKARQLLRELPDYVQVRASITFSRDLTMEELDRLTMQYPPTEANFIWSVLRTGENTPGCGIHLTEYLSERYQPEYWEDTDYPDLFPERYNWSAADMEQHVLSMLRFADDQSAKGTGFVPSWADPEFYRQALSYMEENGVKTYGCYVIATPETLLKLMEDENVACIRLEKAWIGV